MFEEVPRPRRGVAGFGARRIVLGPFVVGGSVLLGTVGGSVAVAATVITASTVGLPDRGPTHSRVRAVAPASPARAHAAGPGASGSASAPAPPSSAPRLPDSAGGGPDTRIDAPTPAGSPALSTASADAGRPVGPAPTIPPSRRGSATPSGPVAATPSPSAPAGNALIHVDGFDAASYRTQFRYAVLDPAAGTDAAPGYRVASDRSYSAGLAPDLRITSGRSICPPAGTVCSTDELIAAAANGFYAEVAIDAAGQLQSVIERDDGQSTGGRRALPTPPTSSPPTSSQPTSSQPTTATAAPTTAPAG
jgi:hypothetical protein